MIMEKEKGYLIALSGLDGSGKSTQAENLKMVLEERGYSVNVIHLKTVESKKYLVNVKKRLDVYSFTHKLASKEEKHQVCCAFLYCEKVNDIVGESLFAYDYTILDRYRDSALCNHYMLGKIYPSVQQIYDSLLAPYINVFLDYPPVECYFRLQQRTELSPFETPEYLDKAYKYYYANKEKFLWIDARKESKMITDEIMSAIC